MKKLFLFLTLSLLVACNTEQGYVIEGNITGDSEALKAGKVILSNMNRKAPIADTVDIVNGVFTFIGNVSTPERYYITIEGMNSRIPVFVENTKITISAVDTAINKAVIKGGETQRLINLLNAKQEELAKDVDFDSLNREYGNPLTTPERREEIIAIADKFQQNLDSIKNELIANNKLSHFALNDFASTVGDMEYEEAQKLYQDFRADTRFEGNRFLDEISETIKIIANLQIGMVAPEFKMKNPEGTEIALSEIYKNNKITMIDFWAGWCGPCRNFNPTLVKIYEQFHEKGFEVLGVSLDRDRELWLKAIQDDKLVWPQVSDVNYWDCEPVSLYNVRYIPQNAFVDQEGKILGRKLAEEDIVKLLEEHLL